jgi:hypothetical protein
MATQENVRSVENLIQHQFEAKELGTVALTAAGAETLNHHGNRVCARYGRLLIEIYVLNCVHSAGFSPGVFLSVEIKVFVLYLLN